MRALPLVAAAATACALAAPFGAAQYVAPGYVLEKQHFSEAPGVDDTIEAPGQEVPGFLGQTHVPSLSAQGRGNPRQRPLSPPAPQP